MTVRFDDAWYSAVELAREISRAPADIVVVRDLSGRIRLVIDDLASPVDERVVADARRRLPEFVGSFTATGPVVLASRFVLPEPVLRGRDLIVLQEAGPGRGQVAILERGVVGADWERLAESPPQNRVSLYGFRGGVGRSTAALMLAQHFASEQKCVLVVDLDLESPGVGSLLQDPADLPDFGIVDFLVESGVGNDADLQTVARSQVVRGRGNGEVWLAPAAPGGATITWPS